MNSYMDMSANSKSEKSGFQGVSYAKMAKSVIIGTIISLFSSLVLFIIFAFIINGAFGDPDKVINIFTAVGASAGALIGGFQASARNGSHGLVSGLSVGLAASLIIFAIMIFNGKADGEDIDIIFRIVLVACQIIFACIGGIFAVNSHSKPRGSTRRSYSASSKNKKK